MTAEDLDKVQGTIKKVKSMFNAGKLNIVKYFYPNTSNIFQIVVV